MSEPIQSIAQNNYILATQKEVSHDNTLSGNGTVDSPLGVVPDYNETVLWSGATPLSSMNGSGNALNLSESLFNFEKVAVYARPLPSHNMFKVTEFQPDGNTEGFDWLTWFKGGGSGSNGVIRFGGAFMQYSDNKLWAKKDEFFQLSVASNGISMQPNQNIITQIVGINRISGSNA